MRYIASLVFCFLIFGCSNENTNEHSHKGHILFIVSNQHTYGNTTINTANHFGEIVLAYDVFKKHNYNIDFVSPEGGAIPIGYISTSDSIHKHYIYDTEFMAKLKHTKTPREVDPKKYLAVYYSGGGAAMFGVPENKPIQNITSSIYKNDGIISAICHGSAGLVNVKDENGQYIYKDKEVNGFPDKFENMQADYYKTFPFSIEQRLNDGGGIFKNSENGWDNYYKVDGRLVTGQDPTASASVAKAIINLLESK